MRLLLPIFLLLGLTLGAQSNDSTKVKKETKLVQISGVIVDDSLNPVPFTKIYEVSSRRGTVGDYYGYFSLVAEVGDTLEFYSMSHKKQQYVIPDTLTEDRYSLIQILPIKYTELETQNIYPWPSKDQFAQAFVDLELADNGQSIAQKNLKRMEKEAELKGIGSDSYSSYQDASRQQAQKLYSAGQVPANNLLNPAAWSKFISAWKNGELKIE